MLARDLLRNQAETVRAALAERKGDSSSLFDKVMGQRVEDLELPFRKWLKKVAGI